MSDKYDIAILGSGLSSLTALSKIIQDNPNLNVCIVSTDYFSDEHLLNKEEIKFLKKYHQKISRSIRFNQLDYDLLKSSKKFSTSLISTLNFGGLGSFWGGGYFPIDNNDNLEVINFINKNFKILTKKNNIKDKFKLRQLITRFFIDSNYENKSKKTILNPGKEINNLIQIYNQKLYKNVKVQKIKFDDKNKLFKIENDKNIDIFSTTLLLACGVINSPKLLLNSKIIDNKIIYLSDHKMYRVPLINLFKVKEKIISFFKNKTFEKNSFDDFNLNDSFLLKILNSRLFLGIYYLPYDFFKKFRLINKICNSKYLCFSQIYLSKINKDFICQLNIESNEHEQKIISNPKLNILEISYIFIFYLSKFFIPLPFKYQTNFGASYHVYGSLKNNKLDIDKFIKNESIQVIDSSTIEKIDCTPSSFLIIKNAYYRTQKVLDYLKNKNN